jgi:light-regulated signal transduction histidine kinase (bacteriophytochrome)
MNNEVNGVLVVARDVTQLISVTKNLQRTKKLMEEQFVSIERKNRELVVANSELVSFTYSASHDLQEPLRKIIMFSSMIAAKEQTGPLSSGKNEIDKIIRVAKNMQDLLEALLNYSSVTHSDFETEETNLSEIVDQIRNELETDILQSNARIIVHEMPVLPVNSMQIRQLFTNLILNSLKFAKPGISPEISFIATRIASLELPEGVAIDTPECWKISVTDNGIGFEEVYAEKIFQLFQRLHSKEDFTGTGIGLTICKKIVHNHGGTILASGNSGQGARFDIFLPAQNEELN